MTVFYKIIFIYVSVSLFIWLHQVLVAACGIWIPNQGWKPAPFIGSPESEPLDRQGSPSLRLSLRKTLRVTDFPGGASANAGDKEDRVLSLSQGDPGQEDLEDPLKGGMAIHSYLENSMDRGACQATVHGAAKSWT